MEVDEPYTLIERLLESDLEYQARMTNLLEHSSHAFPSERWSEIVALDWNAALRSLETYFVGAFVDMPADINALWIGLANWSDSDTTMITDTYLAGSSAFDSFDAEIGWANTLTWTVQRAENVVLAEMCRIAYRDGECKLGNECEYPIALGFLNFAVYELTRAFPASIQCVAAGFDSGDYLFPLRPPK